MKEFIERAYACKDMYKRYKMVREYLSDNKCIDDENIHFNDNRELHKLFDGNYINAFDAIGTDYRTWEDFCYLDQDCELHSTNDPYEFHRPEYMWENCEDKEYLYGLLHHVTE